MKTLLILFFLYHTVRPVKHSLKFYLTGTSGRANFPEFVGTATIDDIEIGYCDSITKRVESKHNWTRHLIEGNPEHLQWYSDKCLEYQQVFKGYIDVFKQHLNQTEGSHVLQRMSGCEWDDESGETKGFSNHGYDGEDFIHLDFKAMTWISSKAQFDPIKHLWDLNKVRFKVNERIYMSECPTFLQEYMLYGRSFLQRTERPSVSLLQKTPSSLISCHATGFYPDRAKLFWRKDGEEIHEDVEKGEILPNNDGTFQMSTEMNVSLVEHEDWRKYECVFQLYGVKEDIITTVDKAKIQTNWELTVWPGVGRVRVIVGVAVLVVAVLIAVLCCYRRGRNAFQPVIGHPGEEDGA